MRSKCRVCEATSEYAVRLAFVPEGTWQRCLRCGGDTNDVEYPEELYAGDALHKHLVSGCADLVEDVRYNLDLLELYLDALMPRTFLDIGSCVGAAMTGMRARGYDAHGFDVSMASAGPQVIVAAKFEASLFGSRKFGCVMLREVIEHVEDWKGLLAEAARAVCRGGLLQVQTPLPAPCLDRICYQDSHLFLVPHVALVEVLRALDLRVCHAGMWPHGQVITCRREVNTR